MSSGCGDVLSLDDFKIAKLHQIFEAEVITGLQGGVSGGTPIDYATNQVTGQVQKTLPAVLRDAGFQPASITFQTGGTLSVNDRNKVVFDSVTMAWYSWSGALPKTFAAATNPLSDPLWIPQTDPNLRSELASNAVNKGASLIGSTSGLTVEQRFVEIEKIKAANGFDVIGRFLNIAALRAFTTGIVGQIAFVASSANATNAELPVGGGYFKAVAKSSLVDDGGVTVVPASGSVAWIRTNTQQVYIEHFGAIGDGVKDSTSAILAAMAYGKANKVNIHAGPGIFETSSSIPIDSNSGLIGSGREKTIFEKTTNNAFTISSGVTADAFVILRAPTYSPDGTDLSNYASFIELSGATFRRKGLTGRSNACAYGIWSGKLCVSQIRDVRVECGNFGFWGEDVWSNTFESVQFLGLSVRQFCGMQISKFRTGLYALSGTSNVFTLVGIANYQIGFQFNSLQYSTMNSCTADGISPMIDIGETNATAYAFINPHGITMNGCGSEGVAGSRLNVFHNQYAIYDATLTINSYQGQIVPQNPVSPSTPIYTIFSEHTSKFCSVSIINCALKKDASLSNQIAGLVSGALTSVYNIGSIIDVPSQAGGSTFKSL